MLRDYTDSARFDGISVEAERLFVRLLTKADDYGRFHADPRLIKAGCFPLIENLRTNDVNRWLDELSTRKLILRYEADGRSVLAIVSYGQRLKLSKAKFPAMDGKDVTWLPVHEDFREVPGSSGNILPEVEEKRSRSRREVEPEIDVMRVRIGGIMKRRADTAWSKQELAAFKTTDFREDEVSLVEDFYLFTERDREPLFRRTGLLSLLNHWPDEVGKASAWAKRYGRSSTPKQHSNEPLPEGYA